MIFTPFFKTLLRQRVKFVDVNPLNLTLEEWQTNAELVSECAKIQSTPIFRAMLETLRNDAPSNYALPKLNTQPTDRIAHLGEIDGYNKCLNNLVALGHFTKEDKPLVATFEPPQVDPQPEE